MTSAINADRKWWAAVGVCMGIFVVALDFTVVNTALPAIQKGLAASMLQLQWIMNIFVVFLSVLLVTMGRFADTFGRRRLFFVGLAVFGLASLLAGLAPNATWLIVWRAFQGVACAILLPCSQSLVTAAFPPEESSKAMGMWMSIVSTGLALGPVLGGIIVSIFSWRWIFYINIPFMIACYLLVRYNVANTRDENASSQVDWFGVTVLWVTIASFVLAVIQGPEWGWSSPVIIGLFAVTIIALIVLLLGEKKTTHPILQYELFANRTFLASCITQFLVIFFAWAVFFLVPLYLHNIRHDALYVVGAIMLSITLPVVIVSPIVGHAVVKRGAKSFVVVGLALYALSGLLQSFFHETTPVWYIVIALASMGFGWALTMAPATSVALSTLPPQMAATASGALTTVQEIGGAVGLAITGTLFRSQDQLSVQQHLTNANITLTPQQQTLIKSFLSDPGAVKQQLLQFGTVFEEKILPIFKNAYLHGYSSAMWLLFALSCVAMILVALLMQANKKTANT